MANANRLQAEHSRAQCGEGGVPELRKRIGWNGYETETERRGAGLQSAEDKLSLQLETKQLGVRLALCIPITRSTSARRRSNTPTAPTPTTTAG